MTNQTPESVIAEVIEYHADTIGSHYDGCYMHHAVCLAVKLRDMLRESGVPDAATAALERVRAVLSAWEMVQARNREYFESGNPGMIVPIDCTGGLRAALDGAPEPEWEYRARLQSCGFKVEGYVSANYALEGLKGELEEHDYLEMDDTAIVERAHVREWLPVEGESKP